MNQEFSREVEERIVTHVMKDLDPSWLVSHTKVAIASVVGGLASLLLCGQFGLGLTNVANSFNEHIHHSMGPIPCAIVCGFLYAIFPIVVLRFFLSQPLQFRAIMRRRWQVILIWFGGFGGLLASFGHHGTQAVTFAAWIVGAVATANLVAHFMYAVAPDWNFSERFARLTT